MPRSEKTFPPRTRRLSPNARRALALLASSPHGINEVLLVIDHGFTRPLLVRLVRAGLAVAEHEVIKEDDELVEVVQMRITDAGRKALGAR